MRNVEINIDDFIVRMWEESINEIQSVLASLNNDESSHENEECLREVCNVIVGRACAVDELKAIYSTQQRGKDD